MWQAVWATRAYQVGRVRPYRHVDQDFEISFRAINIVRIECKPFIGFVCYKLSYKT